MTRNESQQQGVCVAVIATIVLAGTMPARADEAARDVTPEVRSLYVAAACGGDGAATPHCTQLARTIASWRAKWLDVATPFFAELLHDGYPDTVVYPFGGGDLATLLAVYPNATTYTTLSLEGMGDPSALVTPEELAKLRAVAARDYSWAWNTTIDLSNESSAGGFPTLLALALIALHAHGYEPVEARYFTVADDGSLHYVTQRDLDTAAEHGGKRKRTDAVQTGSFANIEIVFRNQGDPKAPRKTFRHIAADLSDAALAANPGVLHHLEQTHRIAVMTKAASYLLWKPTFATLRDYLLGHMTTMISDDTGVPPRFAQPAGFTQDVWGTYRGAHFDFADRDVARELVALWKSAANRGPLPFRFGYWDNAGHAHLMWTHQ